MIINRDNYEEFFLLYVDKELDADGQEAVEAFVSQNPDLARELELLQRATLCNDNIHFEPKEILYRKENSVSLLNYEEYFLLLADNELNAQQAAEVENFVLKHPQLQNEFTLLQQTKLQPELIAYAGKEKLYRKEKVRTVLPLLLIRMGEAATIAGIVYISFITLYKSRSNHIKPGITTTEKHIKKTEENDSPAIQKSVTEKMAASLETRKKSSKNTTLIAANNRKKQKKATLKSKETQSGKEAVAANNPAKNRKIPAAEQYIDIAKRDTRETASAELSTSGSNLQKAVSADPDEENTLMINEPISMEDKPLVTRPVYLETKNIEEEKSVYIAAVEINKNKLKGFFKKATVFLDKKIRRNDD